jgi:hypothetical protein
VLYDLLLQFREWRAGRRTGEPEELPSERADEVLELPGPEEVPRRVRVG